MMNQTKFIILFGESGAGKDTLQRQILNNIPNTKKIISYTTRPRRGSQVNNLDYYFVNDEYFEGLIKNNELIEYNKFNNWYYGISFKEFDVNKINIGILTPAGINTILNKDLPHFKIYPIRILASDKTRLERCLSREKNPDYKEIERRFLSDQQDFKYINFDYIPFVNDETNTKFTIVKIVEKLLKGKID